MKQFKLVPTKTSDGQRGTSVECLYMDCSDGMWQGFVHAAVFADYSQAEAFMIHIRNTSGYGFGLDLAHWLFHTAITDAIQAECTATPHFVPSRRPASAYID